MFKPSSKLKFINLIWEDIEDKELNEDELKVLDYFVRNISVGEILAVIEIKRMYGIDDPESVIRSLIEKGLLERGEGCYNLAPHLRRKVLGKIKV